MNVDVIVKCGKCRKTGKVDIHSSGDGYYTILEDDLTIKGWHIIDGDDIDGSKIACILCSECYNELMANVNNLYRRFMESKI